MMKTFLKEAGFQIRWGLPVWLLWLLSSWWPNNRITLKIRGALYRPFIGKCGRNLQIAGGVRIINSHKMEFGDNVYLSYNCWLNGLGGLVLEDGVIIGPFVTISSLTHVSREGSFRFGGARSGEVRIGRGSWLAAHVSVAYDTRIGAGCLIAANSAVTRDIPAGKIAGGVPARVIGDVVEHEATLFSRSGN